MTETVQTLIQELTREEKLAAAKEYFNPSPCPCLPWLTDEELLAALDLPDGPVTVAALYKEREERVHLSGDEGDPLRFGFEFEQWKDADRLLSEKQYLYVAGGNRASKSEWAAKRFVESCLAYGNSIRWCFQATEDLSRDTQQKLIWKYLPQEIKALNFKHDPRHIYKVRWSLAQGFTEGLLVLPNKTQIVFKTYKQLAKENQGIELGARRQAEPAPQYAKNGRKPPNIGVWADENMPLDWFKTLITRLGTRGAKLVWTFTAIDGITTTVKEFIGTARTLESRPSELLASRKNLPDLPVGHMPYIQEPMTAGGAVIYFFTQWNPFSGYAEKGGVKFECENKSSEFIERKAYGYARDVMNKCFPLFGPENIVKRAHLPRLMTRYMLTDPGDASRNWASIWVGVASNGWHYIYMDWPDAQTYGEWAVPSANPMQADGDRGDAQRSLGFGVAQFAAEWRRLELTASGPLPPSDGRPASVAAPDGALRRSPVTAGELPRQRDGGADLEQPAEEIFQRFIDPRAAANEHIEEHGGTNLYQKFAELNDPMIFTPWSGVERAIGYAHVNALLYWNKEKPLEVPLNCPKLYVCEECLQVIWMFSNYTGMGGERAGGKDFADLVRGMALADLQYYETGGLQCLSKGGSY
jgi:hypothetical protein